MNSLNLIEAKQLLLQAIMKILYDDTACNHDEFTFCPGNLISVFKLLNIYSEELVKRIYCYELPAEHNYTNFQQYWENFIDYLIEEPNDVDLYYCNLALGK